jgi:hypothetical protein
MIIAIEETAGILQNVLVMYLYRRDHGKDLFDTFELNIL